jgi:formylglycine-generating enzyme required for sulfatase activity
MHLSVDLPPYTLQFVDVDLPNAGEVTKTVTLARDKDFIAACGMPMIWVPAGNFWSAKYPMMQNEFELVAKYNPSFFRNANRPVETISWDNASAFCDKLTDYEREAGKLPAGYKYSLPTESQWSMLSADADIDQAATSRVNPLSSTQDVGYSEPNKYGIYDSLGNVWEWCLDADDQGNHSLRGGTWLSSSDNFPSADTRTFGTPKNADRFTGFRVVLVPQ